MDSVSAFRCGGRLNERLRAPPGPTRSNRPDSGRELSRDQQKLIRLMLAHWIQETQGLVALVKGRMERMASLPFDGSRRGIHFEGSMQLESCCTGASLAAGDVVPGQRNPFLLDMRQRQTPQVQTHLLLMNTRGYRSNHGSEDFGSPEAVAGGME